MEKMSLSIQEFRQKVGDKIFSATFTKKDGSERLIVARLGVKSYLKGGELKYNAEAANNLIVFDMQKKEYRTIPFDRLKNIKFNGEVTQYVD